MTGPLTTAQIVTTALESIRTHFLAAAADIRPDADVQAVTMYTKAKLPIWKLKFVSMVMEELGKPVVNIVITAEAIYKIWPLQAGRDAEIEEMAQLELVLLPTALRARPRFQSTAHPRGCTWFRPEGISVVGARIASGKNADQDTLDIVIDLILPLQLQLEEGV